jgi:hypothetical protein
MKCYKGFDKDLKCRGFQYEVGAEYTEDEAEICESGFHACESPLDVFKYYEPGKMKRYCEVDLDSNGQTQSDDSKRVGKRIKIGAEIGIAGLIKAHFEYVNDRVKESVEKGDSEAATAGNRGAATAGEYGAATAGEYGAATAGNRGAATAGYCGAATAGEYGAATAGYCGAATAGEYGAATAGYCGAATAGEYGAATAGYCGAATAGEYGAATSRGTSIVGKNGLAVARGNGCLVKGGLGAVLVIAEEDECGYDIIAWKAVVVDGENIKADTLYELVGGELKEVEA